MAKSGSITVSQGTQEIGNNRTYVTITGYISTSGESWRGSQRSGNFYIYRDGTQIDSGSFASGAPKNSTTQLFTHELWVSHDSDGYGGTITASYNYDSGWCTGSGSTVLSTIPRKAEITGAHDVTDKDNPYFTFSNPGGFDMYAELVE